MPLESTAENHKTLYFRVFEASRAFPEFSPPQYVWGCLFFEKGSGEGLSELVMEIPAGLRVFLSAGCSLLRRTEFSIFPLMWMLDCTVRDDPSSLYNVLLLDFDTKLLRGIGM